MKFKRTIAMLLSAILMLTTLSACGSKTEEAAPADTTAAAKESVAADASPAETEVASVDEPSSDVDPESITPYSNGPRSIEEIVAEMLEDYKDLPELSDEDKNYTVNLGYYNCDHMAAASVGEYTGIFEGLGLKVSVTGNGNVPEAMSAGQMDMAYCGWTTSLSAVQKNVPLFIAAENHTGGSEYLVVSNAIETPQDLVGKKISVGTDPETTSLNWAEYCEELDIPLDSTMYETYTMGDADEYLALAAGDLDGYNCCDPWGSMAEYTGVGKIIARQNTDRGGELGHGTCCKVAMNYEFAEAHPALAERMLLAHTLCIQFMYEHPYYAAEIFSAYYNVPVEVSIMTYWRKFVNEGRTIRWDLNLDYMRNQLDTMVHYGIRDDINTVNVEDYVDLTYFNNCGARDFVEFIETNIDPVFPEGMDYESFKAKALAIDGMKAEDVPEYVELDR
ncbi:MAG: ABC transporter substrate-binding protein [Lachnospiraceae bacterium]|nr:ABC transporter substrate-binding protein [Lachnospiraceae bacterium]